jgi:hypothetical protein
MATAITEKPMASAIVTAQTEIHMIGPMMVHRQRAYGDLVPAGGHKCRDQTGHERGQLRQFRDVRVPIARIGSGQLRQPQSHSGRTESASYCGHGHNISSGIRIDD